MHANTRTFCILAALSAVLMLAACGTSHHVAKVNADYVRPAEVRIGVGQISNDTGLEFDVDVVQMLRGQIEEALRAKNLLAESSSAGVITLKARIVEYEKGSAFKRWLVPGFGSTVLKVQCELLDGGQVVGFAEARRTVDAGGGYTIGAWKSIFRDVARDLVADVTIALR
jgi:hypothetical protein